MARGRSFENGVLNRSNLVTDHCCELEPGRLMALIGEGTDRLATWTGRGQAVCERVISPRRSPCSRL
jgi:hypothetical protein